MKILFINKTILSAKIFIVNEQKSIIKKIEKKGNINFLLLVKKISVSIKSVQGIVVVSGSDTFSISRGSVAIANTLAYIWNIPIAGIDRKDFKNEEELIELGIKKIKKIHIGKFALPIYNKEPNIT